MAGNTVGALIKEYIKDHGITQTWLANKADIDYAALHAALNENRVLYTEEYFSICEVLGLPYDTFRKEVKMGA
ncbi:MAG: hypothetical protein WC375_10945 [Methanomassiliicoccales archaeon]